jgi:hypothetical protein
MAEEWTDAIGSWVNPSSADVDQISFHTMHFNLGVETITTKNDGGFHIMKRDSQWRDWTQDHRTPWPVLSLEVLCHHTRF